MAQESLLGRSADFRAEDWRTLTTRQGWQRLWTAAVRWAKRKVVQPLIGYLRQGTDPRLLALSAAVGLTFGLFPIAGLTAACCGLAALAMRGRCHIPTMLLVNMLATPLELSLILPFMRLGEKLLRAPPLPLDPSAFWDILTGHGSSTLFAALGHAVLGWGVIAPFLLFISFYAFLPLMQSLARRFATGEHSPTLERQHSSEDGEAVQGRLSAVNGTAATRRVVEHTDVAGASPEGP